MDQHNFLHKVKHQLGIRIEPNIIVPFWAKSAATLLSLGGSTIIMDEFGEFGPIDIQLPKQRDDSPDFDSESALNDEYSLKRIEDRAHLLFGSMFTNFYENESIAVNKTELSHQIFDYLAQFYEPLLRQINPYKLGDKKRKLEIGEQYAKKILLYQREVKREVKDLLVDFLVNGCPDHGYVVDYEVMHGFLPKVVKKSSIFGPEYAQTLTELTGYLIDSEQGFNFVGFVDLPDTNKDLQTEEGIIADEESLDELDSTKQSILEQ